MSNEEFERKMTFIVEQQAQFASDIQRLQESQSRTEQIVAQSGEIVAHTGEIVAQTGEIVARLANVTHVGFNDVNAKINALVDSQIRTDEKINALGDSQIRTDEVINALGDSQIRTDESVRNLAAVVDRYIDKGRNGKSVQN